MCFPYFCATVNGSLLMHGRLFPIRLIHLIRSCHFEKLDYFWGHIAP